MNWVILIVNLLPVVIQAIPSIPSAIKTVITDIVASLGAVANSGVIQAPNASNILIALSAVIAALKAEPNIPPDVLNLIAALDRAAQAALAADQLAQVKVDPTQLQPIAPIV